MEYRSSDESDRSEDENGESRLSCFLVKKLPWERTCLKKIMSNRALIKPTCEGLTSEQDKI